ncbi:hypothetical protein K469DRAFT_699556 [Zopfia rhizophila CBS 207.26]|uniref:DUF829-domain-containing protein n=1 Tax=Zopfia rhizophila CBS 207.26 TaxID=1314779 RepID=A0A6A6EWJ7_9PEZI|nr:hypothetical protein K469DRAFT_699556 [Zopfia rhizophila CBS 207.26]
MAISLANFTKLNQSVSLLESGASKAGSPIALVVLCTWVGARPKHIQKYDERYRQLYPSADIIIIASSIADMSYRSDRAQRDTLKPAREVILSHGGREAVLLHAFSNGGAQCASQLAASLPFSDRQKAFKVIILDSCPGVGSYQRSANAMKLSLPRGGVQQAIGVVLIHITLIVLFFCDRLLGVENAVSATRKRLLKNDVFPLDVPRLYIYSKTDDMVPDVDVHMHAEDARRNGYLDIRETVFDESAHCAHAVKHDSEYWKAVGDVVKAKL